MLNPGRSRLAALLGLALILGTAPALAADGEAGAWIPWTVGGRSGAPLVGGRSGGASAPGSASASAGARTGAAASTPRVTRTQPGGCKTGGRTPLVRDGGGSAGVLNGTKATPSAPRTPAAPRATGLTPSASAVSSSDWTKYLSASDRQVYENLQGAITQGARVDVTSPFRERLLTAQRTAETERRREQAVGSNAGSARNSYRSAPNLKTGRGNTLSVNGLPGATPAGMPGGLKVGSGTGNRVRIGGVDATAARDQNLRNMGYEKVGSFNSGGLSGSTWAPTGSSYRTLPSF